MSISTPAFVTSPDAINFNEVVSAVQPLNKGIRKNGTGNQATGKIPDGILVTAESDIAIFVSTPSSTVLGLTAVLSQTSLGTKYFFPNVQRTTNGQVSV